MCEIALKQRPKGKVQILFFKNFLLVLTRFSFWEEDWALGYNSMKFLNISKFLKILVLNCLAMRKGLVYIIFITNNHDLLHLWRQQKFCQTSKILKILLSEFTSLLIASIVKTVNFGWNLLYLSEKRHRSNFKGFQYHIWTSVKRWEK